MTGPVRRRELRGANFRDLPPIEFCDRLVTIGAVTAILTLIILRAALEIVPQ